VSDEIKPDDVVELSVEEKAEAFDQMVYVTQLLRQREQALSNWLAALIRREKKKIVTVAQAELDAVALDTVAITPTKDGKFIARYIERKPQAPPLVQLKDVE